MLTLSISYPFQRVLRGVWWPLLAHGLIPSILKLQSFTLLCYLLNLLEHEINRGSYMRAHVLLNLLNELGKRDKMRGLPSILSLFRNEFNKFNNTRARMLDSIYHMTLRLLWNLISAVKTLYFCYVRNVVMDVITFPVNLYTTSYLSILLHGVISLPDATSYDKASS